MTDKIDYSFIPETTEIPKDSLLIEPIDLEDAERIAREEILFLSEDDLIEELERMDLTPLNPLNEIEETETENAGEKLRAEIFDNLGQLTGDEISEIEMDVSSGNSVIIEENIGDIKSELAAFDISQKQDSEPEIEDITNRIVFLDDVNSVNEAVSGIDKKKQYDMKKLLGYLDGLFEKLPEDTVKKFANSEYFDLYLKILNDLGV